MADTPSVHIDSASWATPRDDETDGTEETDLALGYCTGMPEEHKTHLVNSPTIIKESMSCVTY